MINTLQFQDEELNLITASYEDIINSITLDDVKNFLESLGVTRIQVNYEKQYLICPTICHNPLNEAESMKLYWYQDNKIFRCYTECNEAMSIFTLYKKYMDLNYYPISNEDAIEYVKKCLKHILAAKPEKTSQEILNFDKYHFSARAKFEPYNENVLDCFIKYYHPAWLKDGITKAAMDKFNILYSISHNSIVIPERGIDGELIGVRERIFDENEIKEHGKYHPITVGNINYSHSNQFSLYGIYEHKEGIKKRRSAILVEGEKSVLLDDGFYGEYSNAVAVRGSNTNKYHISLLTDVLGANEIVIAFDKEYEDWHSTEAKQYRKKLEEVCRSFMSQATFSYIWDYDNVLKRKDSPYDRGKDVFEYLYKNRVRVK